MHPVIAPEMTEATMQIVIYFFAVVATWMGWATAGHA